MLLAIESQGNFFFRRITIKNGEKIFAKIKFKFSLFQNASIFFNNETWNFIERGVLNTSQSIIDSNNRTIISRRLNTPQQIKNSIFRSTAPLIIINIGESTYSLERINNSQKYRWLKEGIAIGIEYDLNELIQSQSKLFPKFRNLWKFNTTLPDNADQLALSLLFLGLFELIQRISLTYSS